MAFDLQKLFVDVFAPESGDVVTIMYDLPHEEIRDSEEWRLRREMASAWHRKLKEFATLRGFTVNPIVTYYATGAHNSDLPETAMSDRQTVRLEEIVKRSTIILSMPQYSASAPLGEYANDHKVDGGHGAFRKLQRNRGDLQTAGEAVREG